MYTLNHLRPECLAIAIPRVTMDMRESERFAARGSLNAAWQRMSYCGAPAMSHSLCILDP